LVKEFEDSSNNTLQEMLNEIKAIIENYVNKNPTQPLHFLLEESYKANKTVVITKENILLLCKKLLLNDADIFKEFQISRKYFENDWAKERIPYLINEFGNTIKENSHYFKFEYDEIQKKIYFYYSNQIDQVNILNDSKYEDINEEFLINWQNTNENINSMVDKSLKDLALEYTNYDNLKVQFVDDLKAKTRNLILECNENIDADCLINSMYIYAIKMTKKFN